MSRWQGRETGKGLDLLGLHVWLHDASTIRSIGSEKKLDLYGLRAAFCLTIDNAKDDQLVGYRSWKG